MFNITKREIIVSISIIAIMVLFGLLISSEISENQTDRNEMYNKALKINSTELFQYGMDTNIGNAFIYGDMVAVDTVSYPELSEEYIFVEKIEKRYEKHTRTVKKEDSNGNEYTTTEVYYEWDTENIDSKHAKEIMFCGIIFPWGKIHKPAASYIDSIQGERVFSFKSGEWVKVKFEYYGVSTNQVGTIFTELMNGTISDNTSFYKNMTIDETIHMLQSRNGVIVFWILWVILILLITIGFYYLENKWLE